MDEQQAIRVLKGGDLAGLDTLTQHGFLISLKTPCLIFQH